ncbi:hypothetical protein M433DRAFT_66591 [Acidomyces richmondensis BFW]|nr:MAG: hypothetical protein FE78DRAFT_138698 [Acidomyces sp. 'richmondensis']KYG45740.1 hypothetical protein M433DRAFT_66591 [Acidomyces richmondensis BFW]
MDLIDLSDPTTALSLPHIRYQLIRLEDTVLFHLIERAQFPLNPRIYQPGAIPLPSSPLSFSDWVLREQERLQSRIRRFLSPDEYPFFPDAMEPLILPPLKYPKVLWENDVNVNRELKKRYVGQILPAAVAAAANVKDEDNDDMPENYGSAATADVTCLQALSRRIHFGKFVAESKFLSSPSTFVPLIRAKDRAGIDAAITDAAVEAKVLARLRKKAEMYGADPNLSATGEEGTRKIDVEAVVEVYERHVIPLTKVVEVEYLMQRLRGTEWE